MGRYSKTPEERFAAKTMLDGDCLIWTGAACGTGRYGEFYLDGIYVKAHIYAYERAYGQVPAGLELDHICRHTLCVEPTHLEPVTHQENVRRGLSGELRVHAPTCHNGHPYDGNRTAQRGCRLCGRESQRRYRSRQAVKV